MGLWLLLLLLSSFKNWFNFCQFQFTRKHSTLQATIEVVRKKLRKNFTKLLNNFGRYVIRSGGFLQFKMLIAEEISSLITFLKEKNFVFVRYGLFYSNYALVIIIMRNITFTKIIIKNIYTKIRKKINKIAIESLA